MREVSVYLGTNEACEGLNGSAADQSLHLVHNLLLLIIRQVADHSDQRIVVTAETITHHGT